MRSSSVLGEDIHAHSGDPAATRAIWKAEVTAVDTGSSTATVVIPGYSRDHDYDQAPYMPRGDLDLSPGDDCWVAFDDDRNAVVVCWVPA